jgi:hypothetical protein
VAATGSHKKLWIGFSWAIMVASPTWGISLLPEMTHPHPISPKTYPFHVAYAYGQAIDIDTDALQLYGTKSQLSLGWQGIWENTKLGTLGWWGQHIGKIYYHDGDTDVSAQNAVTTKGIQMTLQHEWMEGQLLMKALESGNQTITLPTYDVVLGSALKVGLFSESDAWVHNVDGHLSGTPLTYIVHTTSRQEGWMTKLALWDWQLGYRMGTASLTSPDHTDTGQLRLTGSGQHYRLFAQTGVAPVLRFETEQNTLSGQGQLLSTHQDLQASLNWALFTHRRTAFTLIWGTGQQNNWSITLEDLGIQLDNSTLQTTPLWEGDGASAIGRKHFTNEHTDYRLQQVTAGWAAEEGFSGSLTLGRLAFLGHYREYETPLFFTYYLGSYTADIEELDYLSLRLRHLWKVTPNTHFFVEGRQFLPFRIVKAVLPNTSENDGDTDESDTQKSNTEDVSGFRWSGLMWTIGFQQFF